jgi:hypothetical protein
MGPGPNRLFAKKSTVPTPNLDIVHRFRRRTELCNDRRDRK